MARSAGRRVFSFDIPRTAGFDVYGKAVRANVERILEVLANPCLGQRLRHPPGTRQEGYRWDDFCKLDLPHNLRLIYFWDPEDRFVSLELIGFHLSHGELGNVYDALADLYELPLDEGHAQMAVQPCCDSSGGGQTVEEAEARRRILRRARR
jgi:hypothetical protein